MNTLLKAFERFIKKESLFDPEDQLLVAVSGGVDSMVLVHLLKSLGYSPSIAHCNFQLRGEASEKDAAFVAQFGKSNDLKVHLKKFDTKNHETEYQISTQVAARNLRYEWFEELLLSNNYKYLLTAHHSNDQVETMLYNLTKGTGIAGLRGIPLKNDQIRRPLLFATRLEIEAYAKETKLDWREDASNQEDKYSRNHLRLHVIPKLKEINPGLERTMSQNSKRFEALEKLLYKETLRIKARYLNQVNNSYSLALDWYKETEGGQAILAQLLKPFGLNFDQCFAIGEAIHSQAVGKQFYSSQYVLAIDRNMLQITLQGSDETFLLLVDKDVESIATPFADFELEQVDANSKWPRDKNTACLDADQLRFPLKIRNWDQGDAFYPLGMKGKKKLSDFMIDEKIPVNLKLRVPLFESEDDIIWVAGHRIDDRYKVTSKTKRVLIIKMTDHV